MCMMYLEKKADYKTIWSHLGELAMYAPVGIDNGQLYVVFTQSFQRRSHFFSSLHVIWFFRFFPRLMYLMYWGEKWRKTKHLKELKLNLWLYSSPRLPGAGNLLANTPALPAQVSLLSPILLSLPSVDPVLSVRSQTGLRAYTPACSWMALKTSSNC